MGSDPKPAIALDDDCLLTKDLRNSLLGRVKEFASLSNLRTTLINEVVNFKIHYMGELWVLLEFDSVNSKNLFHENTGVRSWFSQLKDASLDFNTDVRIVWLKESKLVPFKLWSGNTFKRIASKWEELLDVDNQEDTCYHSKRLCLYMRQDANIFENFKIIFWGKVFWIRAKEVPVGKDAMWVGGPETLFEEERHSNDIPVEENTNPKENHSEDLFGIYSLLNKKKATIGEDGPSDQSPIYPPGLFTSVADHNVGPVCNSASQESMRDASELVCSGHYKNYLFATATRGVGSILVFDG
ncbi:hypothetical protein Tco_1172369 [Tanacetum coccineum]